MKNLILSTIIISTFFTISFAQHTSWCGTEISQEWMEAFYQRNTDHLDHKAGNYPADTIPIIYHIVGDNNGNGYFALNDLFRSHCEIYDLYLEADIYFYILEINYINNTDAFENDNTSQLFNSNNRDACNVYIVEQMAGVCGYSYVPQNWTGFGYSGPNRGGIMLAKNCMAAGNTTYRHEMGHYLNLPHTFYGWEGENPPGIGQNAPNSIGGFPVERADGSNCYASGDGFCDTPPDYLSDRWSCNLDRNYTDPLGNAFTIDERNFMSYSNDGCGTYFKDEQLAEVNNAPRTHRPYLLNIPVPNFDVFPTMGGFAPAVNTSNLNPDEIIVSWNSIPNADYYQVQIAQFNFINPTFDEVLTDTFFVINNPSNNASYDWRVKPISLTNVCTDYSPLNSFTTSSYQGDLTLVNSSCADDSDGSAQIDLPNNATYDYYWGSEDLLINNAIQSINSDAISNLTVGNYDLTVIRNNTDTLVINFTITAANEMQIDINQVGNDLIASIQGGTPPFTYVWNNGVEDYTLSSPVDGDYTFIVIDQNGCQKTATGTFTEATSTAVKDKKESIGSIILAPNPIQAGDLSITIPSNENSSMLIQIIDISGKTLIQDNFDAKVGSNSYSINLDDLSNGIYIFSATMDGFTKSTKLIVNN